MKKKPTQPTITDFPDTHDGNQAKTVFLAAVESREFADPVQALQVFYEIRLALLKIRNQPALVIPVFEQHTTALTDLQKLFVAKRIEHYFRNTIFGRDETQEDSEGDCLTEIIEPMEAYIKRLERTTLPKVADIRETLKDVFRKEMERLPEVLESLDNKDRLLFLCKIMPFVLPKVEAVEATEGEKKTPFKLW